MRGVSKQNAIKRARLKLIKIATLQNKAFASKWPKMRDRGLAIKAKLIGSQVQNQAQEDSIRDITSSTNSIGTKAHKSPSHLN
jgi:hypothetical protein